MVAILAAIAAPARLGLTSQARGAAAEADLRYAGPTAEAYYQNDKRQLLSLSLSTPKRHRRGHEQPRAAARARPGFSLGAAPEQVKLSIRYLRQRLDPRGPLTAPIETVRGQGSATGPPPRVAGRLARYRAATPEPQT